MFTSQSISHAAKYFLLVLFATLTPVSESQADKWKEIRDKFKKEADRVVESVEDYVSDVRDRIPENETSFHQAPTSSKVHARAIKLRNSTRVAISVRSNAGNFTLQPGQTKSVVQQRRETFGGKAINFAELITVSWNGQSETIVGKTFPPTINGYDVSAAPVYQFVTNGGTIELRSNSQSVPLTTSRSQWSYAADSDGTPGRFVKQQNGWMEMKNGRPYAKFILVSQTSRKTVLLDQQRGLYVSLEDGNSYWSRDQRSWKMLCNGQWTN